MRQRTNMKGLVSHTTPNGKSYTSSKNKCEESIKKCQKLLNEGYKLAGVNKVTHDEEPEFKIVMVFGKPMKLTVQEYKDHWNFRIDK